MFELLIGDIVLVYKYPNEENTKEGKSRPAIVLEDLQNEVLLGFITTKIVKKESYKKVIHIKKDSPDFKTIGLREESLIILDDIKTIQLPKLRIKFPPLGHCSEKLIDEINKKLGVP